MTIISYLGPNKTYGEKAAEMLAAKFGHEVEMLPMVSHEAVALSIRNSAAHRGVMAYYNFLEGLVQECLDLIYENNLNIAGVERLPIELCIGCQPDSSVHRRVYSHPKALAQCSRWLLDNHPEIYQIAVSSTAEGIRKAGQEDDALAIGRLDALLDQGMSIIAKDIGNRRHGKQNFTDFYMVAKENGTPYLEGGQYLTMVAITPHVDEPGLLAGILTQIAYHKLNNAKIHSRPAIDENVMGIDEPQMFYIEMECHKEQQDFVRCMDSLRYKLTPKGKDVEVVRVLGTYERPKI